MGNILKGKTIVWVEDDNFLGEVVGKKFEDEGVNIIHMVSGSKALDELNHTLPDLVILDILLPDKDGFEVLDEIKSNDRLKDVPVMMLSNLSQEDNIRKAKELGTEEFYIKSNLSPDQVVQKVEEILSNQKIE